ncbi:MAG: AraC family transcriptional regulator [Oleispira sp.]
MTFTHSVPTKQQSIIGVSPLVALIESYGVSPIPILERTGITLNMLKDAKAKISFSQELAFISAMLDLIVDSDIGFRAGKYYKLNSFGHLGLAVATCDSVEDAIQLFIKYIQLSYTHFDVSFFKTEGKAILRFKDLCELKELRRFYIERDFSFMMISTRDMFPRTLANQKFKAIHFDYECPTTVAQYEALFECTVRFSMPFNEIQFDERYLDRPLPQANPLTRQLLEEQCEFQKVEAIGPEGYVQKIQQVIRNSEDMIPNLEEIAKQFHTTSRTIRRKLKTEGYSFQALLSEELSRKAIHYLETTTITVEQISLKLGYSESSSFIHAFKRWTGKVPKAYRS